MKKKPKRRRAPLSPQEYQHRVECALHALAVALDGMQSLTEFLTEQQGVHWRDLDQLVREAERSLRQCLRWLQRTRRH